MFQYKAYISYSHCDESWAKWLHQALESYRVPRKLVGTETGSGKVPSRVRPVFRDRDDLSSASDLAGTVKQALTDSENMIVVCSPDAAASYWVNEEIRYFASLGRQKQILCVIVDGDPTATGTESGCFPEALAEIGLQEPLAADIRKWADGKRLSRLKLVAGMLGLPLDQLRRRDLQKRQKAWAWASVAAVLLSIILITAITSRIAAQQRRISGESLVAYKLNELRTMLNVTVDPEGLTRLEQTDGQILSELIDGAGEGGEQLLQSAIQLREQGIGLYESGTLDGALEKFENSWLLIAETYRRDRGNQVAFFELGQAEFYIGQVLIDQGEIDKAEESFMSYAEITRRLIVQQPENAEWVLEMAFALTNLGSLQEQRDAKNPERALQLMQSALEYNQIALVLDPQNEYYQSELGQSHAFFADAQLGVCDLEGALISRQKNLVLEQEMLATDAESVKQIRRLAWAQSGLGSVHEYMGNVDKGIENFEKALRLMGPLVQLNPEDKRTVRFILDRKHRLLMLGSHRGGSESIYQEMEVLDLEWKRYFKGVVNDDSDAQLRYASFLVDWSLIVQTSDHPELAGQLLEDGLARAYEIIQKMPGNRGAGNLLMRAAFQYWEMKQEFVPQSILLKLPYYWGETGQSWSCADAAMAARKAIMLGDKTRANELISYLMDRGYREASFMQTCRKHTLCVEQ
jgi:tetratricopeptide (TPR) repeat protein